jgi:signal transduction histidine kinase
MNPEARPALAAGLIGARKAEAARADPASTAAFVPAAFAPVVVAAGYFLGSLLGLSLQFPSTQISAIWPPNAILLAALLVTPRSRWWIYLLAVLPAHLLAQVLMGIPLVVVLINFAGNVGDALLGVVAIEHFLVEPRRFDRLRPVVLIMLFGGILAPAVMSFLVAELLARTGLSVDPWLAWRLRLLTNTLAVFTLVPPLVLAATQVRRQGPSPRVPARRRVTPLRGGEAGALLGGLLVIVVLVFGLSKAGTGQSQILLYLPLPFLLWAALRFGFPGVCLSVLTLGALSMWGTVQGYGPFAAQNPVENATSLILFLNVTCAPLLMLAALLEERQSLDDERRQVETLHGAVLASMHDEIAVLDRDGVIREANESWSAAQRAGPGNDYLQTLRLEAQGPSASAARMLAGIEAVLRGERRRFQTEILDSTFAGTWLEMSVEGLKHPEGGAVLTHTNITSRKQAETEMRRQRQELAHLTRVAMFGELSGALAHELRQPLTAILSNAQAALHLLASEPVDLVEVREILIDIAEDDRRAGDVIQRLRAMLKKEPAKIVPLDLNAQVQEVLRLAHSDLITRHVAVTSQLEPSLPPVQGDRVQLQQVLLNLILNACESMSGNPTGERKLLVITASDPEGVRAAIVDCGTGIPAGEMERVFEPFFTTKEHGLGLGLPICRSLVTAHGGRLWFSNNADRGATFSLLLPPYAESPVAPGR